MVPNMCVNLLQHGMVSVGDYGHPPAAPASLHPIRNPIQTH